MAYSNATELREMNAQRKIEGRKSPESVNVVEHAGQRLTGMTEGNDAKLTRPTGTPSGRVGSAGYVNRPHYTGSAVDKSSATKDTRKQTGTHPTHRGGNF